jgi:hypothetical protein
MDATPRWVRPEWECSVRKCPHEGTFIKRTPWGFELFCERHAAVEDATLEVRA